MKKVVMVALVVVFAGTAAALLQLSSAQSTQQRSDIDRDGTVNITDLSRLLSAWGSTSAIDEDVNENGTVDIQDLSAILANWGSSVVHGTGTQYFVALSGSAANDCSEAQPCDKLETVFSKYGNSGSNELGVSAGDEILFEDGVYSGVGSGSTGTIFVQDQIFDNEVVVRARNQYQAKLTNNEKVIFIEGVRNIVFSGLEITHQQPYAVACSSGDNTAYVIQIRDKTGGYFGSIRGPDNAYYATDRRLVSNGMDYTGNITFTNNIIHSSQCNDLLKMQNVGDITIAGNMFYSLPHVGSVSGAQADEAIDINSAFNIDISGNVFFNDFSGSVLTGSFIVVKDSDLGVPNIGQWRHGLVDQAGNLVPGTEHPGGSFDINSGGDQGGRNDTCDPTQSRCDYIIGSQDVSISRNIFYGFVSTETDKPFIQLGAEDIRNYTSTFTAVTDNLFLMNHQDTSRGPVDLEGTYGALYTGNTVSGSGPTKSHGFRAKDQSTGFVTQYPNDNILVRDNVFSNNAGTMIGWSSVSSVADAVNSSVANNLYWNGGNIVPDDGAYILQPGDDAAGVFSDPLLPDPSGVRPASWDGSQFQSVTGGSGHSSVQDVFQALVVNFCTITNTSPAVGAGSAQASSLDILGSSRSSNDIGACVVQ